MKDHRQLTDKAYEWPITANFTKVLDVEIKGMLESQMSGGCITKWWLVIQVASEVITSVDNDHQRTRNMPKVSENAAVFVLRVATAWL